MKNNQQNKQDNNRINGIFTEDGPESIGNDTVYAYVGKHSHLQNVFGTLQPVEYKMPLGMVVFAPISGLGPNTENEYRVYSKNLEVVNNYV